MSWFRRAERGGDAGQGERLSDLSFEYLRLSPSALMRVSAHWPEGEDEAPDVKLIVSAGAETHELDPLPDPAAGDHTGWRAAFSAPLLLVERSDASFALRLGGEDLPLSAPEPRQLDVEADAAVFDSHDERLAAIAASLARRDDMDDQLRDLATQIKSSREQAAELERRADEAEAGRAEAEQLAEQAEAARVAAEETLNELIEMHSSLKEDAEAGVAQQAELEARSEQLADELAATRQALEEQRELARKADALAIELDAVRESVEAQAADRTRQLSLERDEALRQARESADALAEAERRAAESEARLQEAERRAREADEAREEVRTEAETRSDELEKVFGETNERAEALAQREAEVDQLLAVSGAEREKLEQRVKQQDEVLARQEEELAARTHRVGELEQAAVEADAERARLRALNDDHVAELDRTRAEYKRRQAEMAGSEAAKLLTALVAARDRLAEAEQRHEADHLALTRSLFEDREGDVSQQRMQSSIDAEQASRIAVENAREEFERTWSAVGALTSASTETARENPGSHAPSRRA
jgi:hypothetical protein